MDGLSKNSNHSPVFECPEDLWLQPGDYIVLATDTQKFRAQYPEVKNLAGQLPFSLANSGDMLRLFDYNGEPYRSVSFRNATPWPKEAAGTGKTLELKDYHKAIGSATNWFAGCPGGSPGTAFVNTCALADLDDEKEKDKEKEEEEKQKPIIALKPNPSSSSMMLEITQEGLDPEEISLEIYDMMGTRVRHLPILQSKNHFH